MSFHALTVPVALPETSLNLFGSFVEGGVLFYRNPLSHFRQRGQTKKSVSDLHRNKRPDQPAERITQNTVRGFIHLARDKPTLALANLTTAAFTPVRPGDFVR